ncbi:hypothetical protein G3R49_06780 [Shewanella sp. WXL01]|uniref:Uncharacterized protein n=1 Tax=Shewanella maritima TaxID=2520507 RepID=A0A411PDQ7_9GAMM|nr:MULTISPECIES: hypothetical protein [Shewanella]NKF50277.1 hypothetical protein [Shewanella sp. WXL01]QBF81695.1 hypothetical protein EXU30_02545 [Shewanella maritima]
MRFLVLLVLLLLSFSGVCADERYVSNIQPQYFDEDINRLKAADASIDYNAEKDEFTIYFYEGIYVVGVRLSRDAADSLMSAIYKYESWNKKAIAKAVTLDKEITKVKTGYTFWRLGNSPWRVGRSVDLSLHFYSQSPKHHQLVFVIPKMQSINNQYISYHPKEPHFDLEQAVNLRQHFERDNVLAFVQKVQEQQSLEAEFN